MKHPMMNTHGLVFTKNPMGTEFGEPDVEDVRTLGLGRGRRRRKKHIIIFRESSFGSPLIVGLHWRSYFEMVEVVSSIQVYTLGLLVDGHDGQADVQRAVQLPSLDLKHSNTHMC